jgi:hypothetical protein
MGLSNVTTWEATSGGGRAERAIMSLSHVAAWKPTSQGGKAEGAAMGLYGSPPLWDKDLRELPRLLAKWYLPA